MHSSSPLLTLLHTPCCCCCCCWPGELLFQAMQVQRLLERNSGLQREVGQLRVELGVSRAAEQELARKNFEREAAVQALVSWRAAQAGGHCGCCRLVWSVLLGSALMQPGQGGVLGPLAKQRRLPGSPSMNAAGAGGSPGPGTRR